MVPSLFASTDWVGVVLIVVVTAIVLAIVCLVLSFIPKTREALFPFLLTAAEDKQRFWSYVHRREYPGVVKLLRPRLGDLLQRVKRTSEGGAPSDSSEEERLRVLADFVQFLRWTLQLKLDAIPLAEPKLYWRHLGDWRNNVQSRHTSQPSKRRPFLLKDGALVLRRDIDGGLYCYQVPIQVLLALGLKDALQIFCGAVSRGEYLNLVRVDSLVKLQGFENATKWFLRSFTS